MSSKGDTMPLLLSLEFFLYNSLSSFIIYYCFCVEYHSTSFTAVDIMVYYRSEPRQGGMGRLNPANKSLRNCHL